MTKKAAAIPIAVALAAMFAAPAVATPAPVAKPVITAHSQVTCESFTFTPTVDGSLREATYEVTAQEYSPEADQPIGEPQVFTGAVIWDSELTLSIPPSSGNLLWTYRIDAVDAPNVDILYGERALSCQPTGSPNEDPAPGPEDPEGEGGSTPEGATTPPAGAGRTPKSPKTGAGVVAPAALPEEAATPAVSQPRTAG